MVVPIGRPMGYQPHGQWARAKDTSATIRLPKKLTMRQDVQLAYECGVSLEDTPFCIEGKPTGKTKATFWGGVPPQTDPYVTNQVWL